MHSVSKIRLQLKKIKQAIRYNSCDMKLKPILKFILFQVICAFDYCQKHSRVCFMSSKELTQNNSTRYIKLRQTLGGSYIQENWLMSKTSIFVHMFIDFLQRQQYQEHVKANLQFNWSVLHNNRKKLELLKLFGLLSNSFDEMYIPQFKINLACFDFTFYQKGMHTIKRT